MIWGTLFKKVTIIGVGLIGGSLGLALKQKRLVKEIVGCSAHQNTIASALKLGAIDHGCQDVQKAVLNSNLIVLATPVGIIPGMLKRIASHIRKDCIIIDVGSTKEGIVKMVQDILPRPQLFVGCHPLAGSEKRGVVNAEAELFQNALCLLTPIENTHRGVVERVKRLWLKVGAQVKTISPDEHDQILGYVSHVPHLLVYALMGVIPNSCLEYSAQGLKDTTRVAASTPQMWADICIQNKVNLVRILDDVVKNLSVIRTAIRQDDPKSLVDLFAAAKEKREKIK